MEQVRWTLVVYEFLDNDQFSNLDTLMLQLAPGRCLLTLDAAAAEGKPRGDMAKVTRYKLDRSSSSGGPWCGDAQSDAALFFERGSGVTCHFSVVFACCIRVCSMVKIA